MITIEHLFISPGHNFFGHFGKPAGEHPTLPVDQIVCVAGRGIRGDRFFDHKKDYKGQITFLAIEVIDEVSRMLGVANGDPGAFRRNVVTRGVELNDLIGQEFEIQGVRFRGSAECSPCFWMDGAFAPGTEDALQGRGGLRARILSDGVLRVDARVDAEVDAGATGATGVTGVTGVTRG